MKVLIVASFRSYSTSGMAPFVKDQGDALTKAGVDVKYFLVKGKGIWGYLKNIPRYYKAINEFRPDIVHAHFGLCALFANSQRRVPVVATYHGSDINMKQPFFYSKFAIKFSAWNIFISQKLMEKSKVSQSFSVIPCGVDTSIFRPMDKVDCRETMGLSLDKKYVLFSKMFADPVKNYPLAKAAVDILDNKGVDVELLEFVGYTREQSAILMNAVDAVLMTSFSEGSPQFIKEALACATPIVSVDAGDAWSVIDGIEGCYKSMMQSADVAEHLLMAIFYGKTTGNEKLEVKYSNEYIANELIRLYGIILSQ